MTTRRSKGILAGAALLAVLLPASAPAEDLASALKNLADALVKKRAAVETLSNQLDLDQARVRDEQRAQLQQQADIERSIKAAELELEEIDEGIVEREASLNARQAGRDALQPVLVASIDHALSSVHAGLPFKQEARAKEFEDLKVRLSDGRLDAYEALARVWSNLEDELRLTREIGLHRQRITLDGEALLADVVKLGMVLVYFRTRDERVGVGERTPGGWAFRELTDKPSQRLLATLFEALEKHVREGYFQLPNPYALSPGRVK